MSRWREWMLRGEFELAWQETDKIERLRRQGTPVPGQLVWDGRPFTGRTVLLRNNHGLGDMIQFLRYAPLVRAECSRLIVKAKPILHPLLRTCSSIDEVVSTFEDDPEYDVEMECMELPYIFRTTLQTIPREVPYLLIPNVAQSGHIGLCWASGPWNTGRSVPLAQLAPLAELPGVSFCSLQWGPEWEDARTCRALPICNSDAPVAEELLETARLIASCDLVVSVDTMVAHLAGALGKRVLLLLCAEPDWRWMRERSDSPWYPTMKIFRQLSPGDWSRPIAELCAALGT